MAAKMRYLFQSLHAEAEHFRRHDNRVERVNGDAQAVFVKHAAIKVDLRMPANLIGVEFEMLNRRAVHNHFMNERCHIITGRSGQASSSSLRVTWPCQLR